MDELKIKKTKELGITLIHIPYWWDKKLSSLRATISIYRPDVIATLKDSDVPIPTEPISIKNEGVKRRKNEISSKFMLATNWNKDDDPTGW